MTLNKKILLALAALLILVGILKPEFGSLLPNKPVEVYVLELTEPTDTNIKEKADKVVEILKSDNSHKTDIKRLRDLCLDLGRLVELDGENEVVKTTEAIRQANMLAGPMLRLDIKGQYPTLAKAAEDVIVAAIGDDDVLLNPDLRTKAVQGFNALAWAFNKGSK
jgi:hypothetical protein